MLTVIWAVSVWRVPGSEAGEEALDCDDGEKYDTFS